MTKSIIVKGMCGLVGSLLVFSSCKSDYGIQEPSGGGKGTQVSKKGQYIRFSIVRPNDVTLRSTVKDPMTEIKQLHLLFYDQATQQLQHIREIKSLSDKSLSKLDVQLPAGDYSVVALANATEQIIKYINIGAPLSNLTAGQALTAEQLMSGDGSIAMSNDQGPISVAKASFVNKPSESIVVPISITLEPVLARVLVYGSPQLTGGTKGTGVAKCLATNILKKVSILRQTNLLSTGDAEVSGDKSNREQRYAKSPIWEEWTRSVPSNTQDVGAYAQAASGINDMRYAIQNDLSTFPALYRQQYLYLKESTIPAQAFKLGLTPCLIIAYPYIPNGLTLEPNEGWLSYQGEYYRERDVREMIQRNNISPQGLKEVITRNRITVDKLDSPIGFSIDGLNFYYKGYSYYPVFIKHFASATEDNPYGMYGIVRGNEYHINITHIGGVGQSTPPNYINNTESIPIDRVISTSVRVQELTRRNQEVRF